MHTQSKHDKTTNTNRKQRIVKNNIRHEKSNLTTHKNNEHKEDKEKYTKTKTQNEITP